MIASLLYGEQDCQRIGTVQYRCPSVCKNQLQCHHTHSCHPTSMTKTATMTTLLASTPQLLMNAINGHQFTNLKCITFFIYVHLPHLGLKEGDGFLFVHVRVDIRISANQRYEGVPSASAISPTLLAI